MTRLRCGYCPTAASLAVGNAHNDAASSDPVVWCRGGEYRCAVVCGDHELVARAWCLATGPVRVHALTVDRRQLTLDAAPRADTAAVPAPACLPPRPGPSLVRDLLAAELPWARRRP